MATSHYLSLSWFFKSGYCKYLSPLTWAVNWRKLFFHTCLQWAILAYGQLPCLLDQYIFIAERTELNIWFEDWCQLAQTVVAAVFYLQGLVWSFQQHSGDRDCFIGRDWESLRLRHFIKPHNSKQGNVDLCSDATSVLSSVPWLGASGWELIDRCGSHCNRHVYQHPLEACRVLWTLIRRGEGSRRTDSTSPCSVSHVLLSSAVGPYCQFVEEKQWLWKEPGLFRGSHGAPSANNLIRYYPFLAPEAS